VNLRTLKPKEALKLEPLDFIKWITNHRGGHAHELKAWCNRYLGLRLNPQMREAQRKSEGVQAEFESEFS